MQKTKINQMKQLYNYIWRMTRGKNITDLVNELNPYERGRLCHRYTTLQKYLRLHSSFPLSKYRVLCLFYVLLLLNARCYAVTYEEKICSQLSICSPRQISWHYDNVRKAFQNWIQKGNGNWKRALSKIMFCIFSSRNAKTLNLSQENFLSDTETSFAQ